MKNKALSFIGHNLHVFIAMVIYEFWKIKEWFAEQWWVWVLRKPAVDYHLQKLGQSVRDHGTDDIAETLVVAGVFRLLGGDFSRAWAYTKMIRSRYASNDAEREHIADVMAVNTVRDLLALLQKREGFGSPAGFCHALPEGVGAAALDLPLAKAFDILQSHLPETPKEPDHGK